MKLGDSIRSGTKWLISGRIASRFLQFGFGVVLARLLLPEDFGLLVTVQIFTGFAGLFASAGMGQALIRFKGEKIVKGIDAWIRKAVWKTRRKRLFGHAIIPLSLAERIHYWTLTSFNIRPTNSSGPDASARNILRDYFRDDVAQLSTLIGMEPPWQEFRD